MVKIKKKKCTKNYKKNSQNQFVVDEISKIIKEAIESTIGGNAYQHDKVNNWTSAVVETCLGVLTKLQKPYKYIGKFCKIVCTYIFLFCIVICFSFLLFQLHVW